MSNLTQRAQHSKTKILHKYLTILTQLQPIIKSLNYYFVLEKMFLSKHSSIILSEKSVSVNLVKQNIKCLNNVRKGGS